jgi:hypothetical protein
MGSDVERLFKTDNLRAEWEEWYQKVLKQFNLPLHRLLCGFDDERSIWFESHLQLLDSPNARALHIRAAADPTQWPNFLEHRRYSAKKQPVFDSLIYIPLVAPTNVPFAFVVTLAHELQHFVQSWTEPRVWDANVFLYRNMRLLDPGMPAYETWRVPNQHDAMIKSKRVAVSLFGADIVEKELRSLVSNDETTKEWEFLLGVSPSADCNLRDETDQAVRKYKPQILGLRDEWPSGIDFTKPDWWVQIEGCDISL